MHVKILSMDGKISFMHGKVLFMDGKILFMDGKISSMDENVIHVKNGGWLFHSWMTNMDEDNSYSCRPKI